MLLQWEMRGCGPITQAVEVYMMLYPFELPGQNFSHFMWSLTRWIPKTVKEKQRLGRAGGGGGETEGGPTTEKTSPKLG